jgi:hypothetical protein
VKEGSVRKFKRKLLLLIGYSKLRRKLREKTVERYLKKKKNKEKLTKEMV